MRRLAPLMLLLLVCVACSSQESEDVSATPSPEAANIEEDVGEGRKEAGDAESAAQPAVKPIPACLPEEEPIFSCKLENGKRLAICGNGKGNAQYRYGGEASELTLDGGSLAVVAYSGGGESQIAFTNGDYSYIVFSRMVRTNFTPGEPNNPAISDGVIVLKNDRLVDLHTCNDGDALPVQYAAAERVWAEERELFTDETQRADPR